MAEKNRSGSAADKAGSRAAAGEGVPGTAAAAPAGAGTVPVVSDTSSVSSGQQWADDTGGAGAFVYVASSMQNGITFPNISAAPGGMLTIPGINFRLRGPDGGMLAAPGASVLTKVPAAVWEEVMARYSSLHAFTASPPLIRVFRSEADYRSASAQDELGAVRTGAEPLAPESGGG